MKLFYLPYACSMAPQILLNELHQKFETEKMDKENKASILKYNPKGAVPTLVLDDGKVITEGPAILQYIADQIPDSTFLPKLGTWERYKAMEWLNYVSSELHKGIGILFNPEFSEDAKNILKANAANKLDFVNQHLALNQYLTGNEYSVADMYAFTVISWTKKVGVDISKLTHLEAYLEKIAGRPAVQDTLEAPRIKLYNQIFDFEKDYILEDDVVKLRRLRDSDYEYLVPFALHEPTLWKFSPNVTHGEEGMKRYVSKGSRASLETGTLSIHCFR